MNRRRQSQPNWATIYSKMEAVAEAMVTSLPLLAHPHSTASARQARALMRQPNRPRSAAFRCGPRFWIASSSNGKAPNMRSAVPDSGGHLNQASMENPSRQPNKAESDASENKVRYRQVRGVLWRVLVLNLL